PCYAVLLAVLSFPTRRSSDLIQCFFTKPSAGSFVALRLRVLHTPTHPRPLPTFGFVALRLRVLHTPPLQAQCNESESGEGAWMRSEEHTSELQSRENLVCRLL